MATTNITQLRDELLELFDNLRIGKVKPVTAKEINNTAGKIIGSAKVQLEYCKLAQIKPEIPFLGMTEKEA